MGLKQSLFVTTFDKIMRKKKKKKILRTQDYVFYMFKFVHPPSYESEIKL